MKNMIFATLLGTVVLAGCSTTQQPTNNPTELSPTPVVQQDHPSLFQEAHRCQGTVRYQAEMQRGEMRSRLSCEWQVQPDEWGAW